MAARSIVHKGGVLAEGCPSIELLAAYVVHAVTAEERSAVESHMAWCRECRETVAMTFKSLNLIKDFTPNDPVNK